MKIKLTVGLLAGLLVGCAGTRMAADKLESLRPGETTEKDMRAWFGPPRAVGMDGDRVVLTWMYARAIPYPFYTDFKQQMLTAAFTNDVLAKFVLSDELNRPGNTNALPHPKERR